MDNLAHSFVGLAASKAGLERLSPGATAICLLAANAPDVDIVTAFVGDRWTYLHHHRGITHSIIGTFLLALALPLIFAAVDRLIARIRKRAPAVKLGGLMIASLVVSATHPFMDWTNNYGIRPFLPWSSRWFYGDFVFIVDPFIWLVIGGAAFLLTAKSKKQKAIWILLGCIITALVLFADRPGVGDLTWVRSFWLIGVVLLVLGKVLGAGQRYGPLVPQLAFGILVIYWSTLALLQHRALEQVKARAGTISSMYQESITDYAAMPTLANPVRWQAVVETDKAAYRFDVSLLAASEQDSLIRYERPEALKSPRINDALEARSAQVFLEFARFPVVRLVETSCPANALVQLADLRYTEPGSRRGSFALELPVECPTIGGESPR
jgi:inner membrane protein